jgi:hypothetical protein
MVAQEIGVTVVDEPNYASVPDGRRLLQSVKDQTVHASEPRPGTLGLFAMKRLPFHIGIFAEKHGELSFIHALAPRRKVVEEIYHPDHFQGRLISLRDIPGVE